MSNETTVVLTAWPLARRSKGKPSAESRETVCSHRRRAISNHVQQPGQQTSKDKEQREVAYQKQAALEVKDWSSENFKQQELTSSESNNRPNKSNSTDSHTKSWKPQIISELLLLGTIAHPVHTQHHLRHAMLQSTIAKSPRKKILT